MLTKSQLNLRLLGLVLTFAFGVATSGLGLNVLVKAEHEQNRINTELPNTVCQLFLQGRGCTKIVVDVTNMAVTCLLVGLFAAISAIVSMIFMLLSTFSVKYATNPKVPNREFFTLFVLSWLSLGSLIPMTFFFATKSAVVKVFIGNLQIDQELVDEMIFYLGETTQYNELDSLKAYTTVPWIGWYFTLFAAVSIFLDGRNGRWASYGASRSGAEESDTQNLRERRVPGGYDDPAPSFLGQGVTR